MGRQRFARRRYVDPVRHGAVAGPRSGNLDPRRDEFEIALSHTVRQRGKPVLGICRGAQLINVALGGTLVADLPTGVGESHASYTYPRATRRHRVDLTPDTVGHTGPPSQATTADQTDDRAAHRVIRQTNDRPISLTGQGAVTTVASLPSCSIRVGLVDLRGG